MWRSIIQKNKECFFCGTTQNLQKHHIFGGSRRKFSEADGLYVWLCFRHHCSDDRYAVHNNKDMMQKLHEIGQKSYEEDHTRQEFMERYGKNYL